MLDPLLYDELLRENASAFALGKYQIAFHFLVAALHYAFAGEDDARVDGAGLRAREQCDVIDRDHSGHAVSSRSARARGNRGIFGSLSRIARNMRLVLELRRRNALIRPVPDC